MTWHVLIAADAALAATDPPPATKTVTPAEPDSGLMIPLRAATAAAAPAETSAGIKVPATAETVTADVTEAEPCDRHEPDDEQIATECRLTGHVLPTLALVQTAVEVLTSQAPPAELRATAPEKAEATGAETPLRITEQTPDTVASEGEFPIPFRATRLVPDTATEQPATPPERSDAFGAAVTDPEHAATPVLRTSRVDFATADAVQTEADEQECAVRAVPDTTAAPAEVVDPLADTFPTAEQVPDTWQEAENFFLTETTPAAAAEPAQAADKPPCRTGTAVESTAADARQPPRRVVDARAVTVAHACRSMRCCPPAVGTHQTTADTAAFVFAVIKTLASGPADPPVAAAARAALTTPAVAVRAAAGFKPAAARFLVFAEPAAPATQPQLVVAVLRVEAFADSVTWT